MMAPFDTRLLKHPAQRHQPASQQERLAGREHATGFLASRKSIKVRVLNYMASLRRMAGLPQKARELR